MKSYRKFLALAAAVLSLGLVTGCGDTFEEVTDLVLGRCLQPMNLSAKVSQGQNVTFSWDVTKDAEQYLLEVYNDEEMTKQVFSETIEPNEVPVTKYLDVDQTFWFRVQAHNSTKDDSKWAVCAKSVKTFAVKPNLYMELAGRTATSITLTWTADPEVDRIEYGAPGAETPAVYTLTKEDIAAGQATVPSLTPSTEYDLVLYFSSANRGEVVAWTMPDPNGLTAVSTSAALEQAIKDGANILVKMDGSPYTVGTDKGVDISKGVKIYGEGAADGTMPVIYGSLSVVDGFDGTDIYAEGIEFNGKDATYGFLIQHKEGSATDGVAINSIIFRNCVVTGYSKGIIYEWSHPMKIGELTFDSCDIHAVNVDGTVGGDGFDLRQATEIGKFNIVNNTIYNGFRTFLRIDANPVIGDVKFENNTLMNLSFVDNTNNAGLFGFQTKPSSFSMKKNLFLNMVEKSVMANYASKVGDDYKYLNGEKLGVMASENYFYNIVDGFFTNFTLAQAGGVMLDTDPCYNAKAGKFSILASSEISGKQIGASKWWNEYIEPIEDLTMTTIEGNHTWDFNNAAYFSSDFTKSKVRDLLLVGVTDNKVTLVDGVLGFTAAATTSKKGVPTDGYLAFQVNQPGSVIIKPVDETNASGHFVVGVGPTSGSSISIKGGAAAMSGSVKAQKVIIKDITEESLVYIFPTSPLSLAQLAWTTDVNDVNTALPAPAPKATPATVTAGTPEDVVISWEPVENAGSYSVVFNGKTYASDDVAEGESPRYTIGKTTIGMLDAGSYTVNVFANPAKSDIYNTMSAAGVAAFAIQPKGGSEEGETAFTVKSVDELLAALAAKKESITLLESGSPYVLTDELCAKALTVDYPVVIEGETPATTVEGTFKPVGTIDGDVTVKNLTFDDTNLTTGCFITLAEDLVMNDLTVENVALKGYSKSVVYGNFATTSVNNMTFRNISTSNWGTGQGVFDLRKGVVGSLKIVESTIVGGRDLIRLDATVECGNIIIANNTIDKSNLGVNSNAVLYVRNTNAQYTVANNLFLNEVLEGKSVVFVKATGVAVPHMVNNFFYNVDETNFFNAAMTKEMATDNNGVVLGTDPVKDAANGDYTLVNALAMSNRVGASKWNPSRDQGCSDCFVVKDTMEFNAALSAGKTDLKLEAGEYAFSKKISVVKNLRLTGNGEVVLKGYVDIAGEDLGNLYFDNIHFTFDGSNGCVFNVSAASTAGTITVKNCVFDGYSKSVFYDNAGLTAGSVVMSNNKVINHGTGQGVFDLRKSSIENMVIEQSTIVGGRDLVRADANTIKGAFTFRNNTVDGSNLGVNGNGIIYVRATPTDFQFNNNLFINEAADGKTVRLSKVQSESAPITVPNVARNNFFYNIDTTNFFACAMNKEIVAGVEVSNCPVKDAANGDYTLVDALAMSSNVGPLCWNPRAGRVTTDFTVTNTEELLNAIAVGKSAITLNGGSYNFREVTDNPSVASGILTLTAPLTLKGVNKLGKKPVIVGGLKLGEGAGDLTAQNIKFSGDSLAVGIVLEMGTNVSKANIVLRGCDFVEFAKSVFYHSTTFADASVNLFSVSGCTVSGFGQGQGVFDIRKGAYTTVLVENSTIYNGGRDFIRADAGIVTGSIAIRNNTFAHTGVGAGNGLFWVRSTPGSYVIANNLFLNEVDTPADETATAAKTLMAKGGATKAQLSNNYFFNCDATNFFTGTYTQEEATANGGAVLEADPCKASASYTLNVTNATIRENKVGDPRWR